MTQSVLDQMTAGIIDRKTNKATGLTPVGMETALAIAPAISTVRPDEFPYDSGMKTQIDHSARVIRNELAQIEACVKSIERTVGTPEGGYPPVVVRDETALTTQQAAEAAGDAAAKEFQKNWEAKAKAAQAQTWTDRDDTPESPFNDLPHEVPGWACSEHGSEHVAKKTSRKGREYRACTSCTQFEKEG